MACGAMPDTRWSPSVVVSHVPPRRWSGVPVGPVTPRVGDPLAEEPPDEPPLLHVEHVAEQLQRRPSRGQPRRALVGVRQRQHRGYGSPPLAVRTGLMAAAGTPLVVALAGKANFISALTGIGHERLNVVHRWVGGMILGLSVVHTIPFIVAPLKDGGREALRKQYYKKRGFEVGVEDDAIVRRMSLF